MSSQQDALENLRVIRSLMEKAHIYRAISAPAALTGGLLALAASGWGAWGWYQELYKSGKAMTPAWFLWTWFSVLGITGLLNMALLARDAGRRGQPFVSDGMRMALRAILPAMFVGGVVGTGLIVYMHSFIMAVLIWILCYGLALLGTASFSPRSLVRLGWLFLGAGLLAFAAWAPNSDSRMLATDGGPATVLMGLTFGLFHIAYGLAVAFGKKQEVLPLE